MAYAAGAAFVQVVPSLRGFHKAVEAELSRGLPQVATRAGQVAGGQMGTGFSKALHGAVEKSTAGLGQAVTGRLSAALERLKGVSAAAGLAGGAVLGASLVQALDVTAARGKLQAQLGLTAAESKRVGDVAGKLFAAAYGDSMDEVNAAVTSVVQNMDGMRTASSAALEQTTARALTVAKVMGEDVGGVTAAVSQLMRTGMAKSSAEAFDILTRGQQLGLNKAGDLLDTLNEYPTVLRTLGVDGQTAMGLVSQGLQAGARDSDKVTDALKEFSLRAVDGSKTTADAFKALGLDASKIGPAIAAGGPQAAKALDTVLSRLRDVRGSAEGAQAIQNLFGGPGEDLGAAIFALNVGKATKGLDGLSGATDRAAEALGSTAASRLEEFKRSVMTNVTQVADSVISRFNALSPETQGFITKLAAGAVVAGPFAFGLVKVAGAAAAVARGSLTAAAGVTRFAGGLVRGSAALGENASAAAKAGAGVRSFAGFLGRGVVASAGYVVQLSSMAGQYARTAAQSALAAGKQAVLNGAQAAGAAASRALALGQRALQFGQLAAQAALAASRQALLTGAQIAGNVASKALAIGVRLVNAAMRANPIGLVITALTLLVGGLILAYKKSETFRNIVQGALRAVATVGKWLWNNALKPAFTAIRDFLVNTLAPRVLWFHNSVVRPVFGKVGEFIGNVVKTVRGHLELVKRLITETVPNAFRTGVAAVKKFWNGLIDVAKKPVNFVIKFYNQGVAALVNKLAAAVGLVKPGGRVLDAIPYFARGGVLPGYAPGRDSLIAAVSPGESIFRPEFTRAVGAGFVQQGNNVARRRGVAGVRDWLSGPDALGGEGLAFARGGVVPNFAGHFALGGIIGDFVQGVKDFTIGNVAKGAGALLDKVLGVIPGSGILRDVIAGIPRWIKTNVVDWVKAKIGLGGTGGPGVGRALSFAKAQAGKPYVWGGVGPGGYDCSGFMSALTNVIKGRSPFSRLFSTFSFSGAQKGPQGFLRGLRSGFMVGVTNAGVGHMAGTLGGTNVESRGSAGVVVGSRARGAGDRLFNMRYGLKFDQGGALPPGLSTVYNGTRRPEPVLTGAQWDALVAGRGGDTINHNTIVNARTADMTVRDLDVLQRRREALDRVGRPR